MVILICDDLHNERAGYFRAFTSDSIDAPTMCPLIGYCSPGGSYRTIRETVANARRYDKVTPIYRNGRVIDKGAAQ